MDYEPVENKGVLQYPYGVGALYITGLIGRIMPDGTVDFMENSGRVVLTEGAGGRKYHDLVAFESYLNSKEEIDNAVGYLSYNIDKNEMDIAVDISSSADIDIETLCTEVGEKCNEVLLPKFVNIIGK